MKYIYRVEFKGRDFTGAVTTFRFATVAYATTAAHPTIPNTLVPDGLVQPMLFTRSMFGSGHLYGDPQLASGEIDLDNSDGSLDFLMSYGFDTQEVKLFRVDPAAPNTDYLEQYGFMEQLILDSDSVRILVRDPLYILDNPLQWQKYGGTNVLPDGLDGTPADIQGKPIVRQFGKVFNIEPVCVNTSRLIYDFSTASGITFTLTVYDKRSPLGAGRALTLTEISSGPSTATVSSIDTALDQITTAAAHGFTTADPVHVASSAALPGGVLDTQYYYARVISTTVISLHPTATDATNNTNKVDITSAGSGTITVAKNRTPYGLYDWYHVDWGRIRLGSKPQGRVTMDVAWSSAQTWYDTAQAIITLTTAVTLGLPYSVDNKVGTVAGIGYGYIGAFWKDEISAFAATLELLHSVGATMQVYPNRGSSTVYVTFQRLAATPGTPVLSLDESLIHKNSLKRIVPADTERGIPSWRVNCNYQRNYTVMSGTDLAGSVSAADQAFVALEYRTVQSDNSATKNKYPSAPELSVDTLLLDEASASAHGDYMRSIFDADATLSRSLYSLKTSIEDNVQALLDTSGAPQIPGLMLAMPVQVTYPRFSMNNGKTLQVVEYTLDYAANTAEIILWG